LVGHVAGFMLCQELVGWQAVGGKAQRARL